jgi:hypothetical protein
MSDLFTPPEVPAEAPTDQGDLDYFNLLVGPDKKFKDEKALAKGKYHSDQHAANLEQELKGLRQELETRLTLEKFLEQTKKEKEMSQSPAPSPIAPAPHGEEGRKDVTPAMTKEEILAITKQAIETERKQSTVSSNLEQVKKELVKTWGPNYVAHLEAKAKELNVGPEFLNKLAAEAPQAALAILLDNKAKAPNQDLPPQASARTIYSTSNTPTGVMYNEDYERLRKEDPKRYWSKDVQAKRHRDALALGVDFLSKK